MKIKINPSEFHHVESVKGLLKSDYNLNYYSDKYGNNYIEERYSESDDSYSYEWITSVWKDTDGKIHNDSTILGTTDYSIFGDNKYLEKDEEGFVTIDTEFC